MEDDASTKTKKSSNATHHEHDATIRLWKAIQKRDGRSVQTRLAAGDSLAAIHDNNKHDALSKALFALYAIYDERLQSKGTTGNMFDSCRRAVE